MALLFCGPDGAPTEKCAGDEDGDAVVAAKPASETKSSRHSLPWEAAALAKWMSQAIQVYDVISFENRCNPEQTMIFQALEAPRNIIKVPVYCDTVDTPTTWSVQPLEIWRAEETGRLPSELYTFVAEGPRKIDLLDVTGASWDSRETMMVWSPAPSDLDGCQYYCDPRPLRVNVSLSSGDVPVLCLLDHLLASGWVGANRKVKHTSTSGVVFDRRKPSVPYLQCVLASTWLWENGTVEFLSKRPAAYYSLLLRDPKGDHDGKDAKQCIAELEKLDAKAIPALEVDSFCAAADACDIDGDDGHDDGDDGHKKSDDEKCDEEEVDDVASWDGDGGDLTTEWPRAVAGAMLHFEPRSVARGRIMEGVRVTCLRHGGKCRKFKALHMGTEKYGPKAPLYFLGAWIVGGATRSFEEHHRWLPTAKDIEAFMATPACP